MPRTTPFATEVTVPASQTDFVLLAAKPGRTISVESFRASRGATTTLRTKPAGAGSNLTSQKWSKHGDPPIVANAGDALTVSTGAGVPVTVQISITEA